MKSDTERKIFYNESIHKKKNRMHVHLSKDLRGKLKIKKRSIMVRKDDKVKVMRGDNKGKEAKVSRVSVLRRKVFLEGIANKNARGKELPIPMDPSNLILVAIEPSEERKKLFNDAAFKARAEAKKEEPKKDEKVAVQAASKPEVKGEAKPSGEAAKPAGQSHEQQGAVHTERMQHQQSDQRGSSHDNAKKLR